MLLYDDHGWHPGPSTAVALARAGVAIAMVTPGRMLAFEVGATNYPHFPRAFYRSGVRITPDIERSTVRREGNRLVAGFWNEYVEESVERVIDQVVVEHGALPADELYHVLRDGSCNGGAVDVEGMARGAPEELLTNPAGSYLLYRVGDGVSSRNIHAAIYDSLRLCKGL